MVPAKGLEPPDYKSGALPIELSRQKKRRTISQQQRLYSSIRIESRVSEGNREGHWEWRV
jgi:hypothetical protein